MSLSTHVIFPEHILMGWFKCFFSQEKLYNGVTNEFRYVDGKEVKTLVIEMAEDFDFETPNAVPAIIIQEGGWTEDRRVIDQRKLHNMMGLTYHKSSLWYSFAIHCIARNKGSAKVLHAAASKGIMGLRHAIYELGVDTIDPLVGSPPQNLARPEENKPGPYDIPFQLRLRMEQDWITMVGTDPEEAVRIKVTASLKEVEYDENGDIVTPPSEFFQQEVVAD
jgi:hypothetical protein